MAENLLVIGLAIKCMEEESSHGMMVGNMKVNI